MDTWGKEKINFFKIIKKDYNGPFISSSSDLFYLFFNHSLIKDVRFKF